MRKDTLKPYRVTSDSDERPPGIYNYAAFVCRPLSTSERRDHMDGCTHIGSPEANVADSPVASTMRHVEHLGRHFFS